MREVNRRAFLAASGALGVGAAATAVAGSASAAPASTPSTTTPAAKSTTVPTVTVRRAAQQDPTEATLAEAITMIRSGAFTSLALTDAYLARIKAYGSTYQSYNAVPAARAREAARQADAGNRPGVLSGIPLCIKDNYFTRNIETTANSTIFQGFVPRYDATAVANLTGAGAIVLGKGQMGPLATTRATLPNGTVTTVNAWTPQNPEVDPGGSSTGPATSVAGRLATSSIGTQTGGSIVLPANQQNLTGLKPTMGRISLHGVVPLTYTRDHCGPIARDVLDAAIMLSVMAGPDPTDPRTLGLPPLPDVVTSALPVRRAGRVQLRRRTKVGVPADYLAGVSAEVAAFRSAMLSALEAMPNCTLVDIAYPDDWTLLTGTFNSVRLPERSEPFLPVLQQDPTKFGVSLTTWLSGLMMSGEEWITGQRAKNHLLREVVDGVFRKCDVILQTSVVPFDILGLPELGFPIGFTTATATTPPVPVGAILGGAPYEEDRVIEVVAAYQAVTDWHWRRPADPAPAGAASKRAAAPLRLTADDVLSQTA